MSRLRVSARKRASERFQAWLCGNGWPARLPGTPRLVQTSQHRVAVPHWPASAPPLRIGFASDFHAGPTTHPALWRSACEALERARPDLVLLGGDFVVLEAHHADALAERLGQIHAPLGCYAVLGNHDYYADAPHITERLKSVGIHLLTNRNVRLPPPWDHAWVCGLDDWGFGEPDGAAAFAGADGTRIVLMHSPSSLLDMGGERWDFALAGHVHGGQIALPSGQAIVVPHGALSRRYARGRHRVAGGGTLIVSRGIGASGLPFRAFSPPEVLLCELGA